MANVTYRRSASMVIYLGLENAALDFASVLHAASLSRARAWASAAWSPDRRRPNHAHVNNNLSYYTYTRQI